MVLARSPVPVRLIVPGGPASAALGGLRGRYRERLRSTARRRFVELRADEQRGR